MHTLWDGPWKLAYRSNLPFSRRQVLNSKDVPKGPGIGFDTSTGVQQVDGLPRWLRRIGASSRVELQRAALGWSGCWCTGVYRNLSSIYAGYIEGMLSLRTAAATPLLFVRLHTFHEEMINMNHTVVLIESLTPAPWGIDSRM